MKRKDATMLVVAVLILLVAGYIVSTQILKPKAGSSAKAGVPVEVVGSIPSSLDSSELGVLGDTSKTQDFTPNVDLTTGLGSGAPFGN